ncbi:MAG: DUF6691 family protein [Pseudomonadota bacterium]
MRALVSFFAGGLFGVGLAVSDMIDPARVLAFLDVESGAWDPTLAFVMGGAMIPMAAAWALSRRRAAPALGGAFPAAPKGGIDARLVGGAALFGLGWGLVGFCPGPALAALTLGGGPVLLFVAAMLAGMAGHDAVASRGGPARA